jgi:hypothetical protein
LTREGGREGVGWGSWGQREGGDGGTEPIPLSFTVIEP